MKILWHTCFTILLSALLFFNTAQGENNYIAVANKRDSLSTQQLLVVLADGWNNLQGNLYVYNKGDKWILQFSNPIVLGEKGLGLGGGLISLSIDNVPLKKDDLHSVNYNKLVQKDTATKDYNSHEDILLQQIYYKWGLVVNYNTDKPVPENGSCVFIHIWGQ